MHVKVIRDGFEIKTSSISKRTWPKGWTGEMDDELAVQAILAGLAEDTKGEITREALEEEIARLQSMPAVETKQPEKAAPKSAGKGKKAKPDPKLDPKPDPKPETEPPA